MLLGIKHFEAFRFRKARQAVMVRAVLERAFHSERLNACV